MEDKLFKLDEGKPPLQLLPRWPIVLVSQVLEFGARKYAAWAWKHNAGEWTRLYGAALRHVYAAIDGEDIDPESGLPHEAHAICCLIFILEYRRLGLGKDDRDKGAACHPQSTEVSGPSTPNP